MNVSVRFVVFLTMIIGVLASPLVAHGQDETQPTFVKDRFDVPLDREAVKQEWKGLGYFRCAIEGTEKGWTSERPERQKGEHTHPSYILFAGIAGKMEFIINDQRFVLEPGDELFYPKDAVIATRNLYDGRSQWFECWKSQ
jgi:hypothetical protein